MHVIGTAGHVDHGKSTLVKALTGIDPDRLQEEKEREMTIDLGFAWLKLPNGEEVGVVDVPGHERLVRNMLAGVGGLDLAMLVVAADEGVMAQTREHLAILDLLGLRNGVVVLTKRDLVDQDWLELAGADVRDTVKGTVLEGSPQIAVSARSGEGLPALKALLAERLQSITPRRDLGRPRLPIDRSFAMAGFGTVVTGTLIDGSLELAQEVELVPSGLRARVRGLQSHRKALDSATPGRRLAVNLSGVDHNQVARGDTLALPGTLTVTEALDARIQLLKANHYPLGHNSTVTFHSGTSETPAKVRLLEGQELAPGASALVQLKLERPVAVVKGDRFILRNTWGTVGGGEVLEPHAKRHRRFDEETLGRLAVLEQGTPDELLLGALAPREPAPAATLAETANLGWEQVATLLAALREAGQIVVLDGPALTRTSTVMTAAGLKAKGRELAGIVGQFHAAWPLRKGMPKEEARNQLGWSATSFGQLLKHSADVEESGPLVWRKGYLPEPNPLQAKAIESYLAALRAVPFNPPPEAVTTPELLAFLLERGDVVRIAPDAVVAADAYHAMSDKVTAFLREHGTITVAQVRDLLGSSRRHALALMEHLDQQRITRRVGDERVLR